MTLYVLRKYIWHSCTWAIWLIKDRNRVLLWTSSKLILWIEGALVAGAQKASSWSYPSLDWPKGKGELQDPSGRHTKALLQRHTPDTGWNTNVDTTSKYQSARSLPAFASLLRAGYLLHTQRLLLHFSQLLSNIYHHVCYSFFSDLFLKKFERNNTSIYFMLLLIFFLNS